MGQSCYPWHWHLSLPLQQPKCPEKWPSLPSLKVATLPPPALHGPAPCDRASGGPQPLQCRAQETAGGSARVVLGQSGSCSHGFTLGSSPCYGTTLQTCSSCLTSQPWCVPPMRQQQAGGGETTMSPGQPLLGAVVSLLLLLHNEELSAGTHSARVTFSTCSSCTSPKASKMSFLRWDKTKHTPGASTC